MRKEFERFQRAVGTHEESKKDLNRAMRECWPIGSRASYRHGDNVIFVQIRDHSNDDRLKVYNPHTGATYWVSMYRFFDRKST